MLKGYAINQKRLEYLEKTIKLIDIANRIDERLEGNDAKEILKVIGGYSKALDLLDDYDHRTLKKFEGNIDDSESYFAGENGTIIMCEHDYMNNFKRLGELKNGDIITSIDNIELNTMNDLREYIYTKKPNDEVNLKIIRGKINKEFNIVLGKK